MRKNSEIEVQYDETLSNLQKQDLIKKIKDKYGENVTVKIKNNKSKNDQFEQNRLQVINNNLKEVYVSYLNEKYPNIDQTSFFNLDEKINTLLPDQTDQLKRFRVKWFGGKNILSFNEFEVNLENRGILRIYSEPENMGGKSNLIRCLKILLFGEFYRSNMERSTLSTIMNKYSPLNLAYLEGEIEIENKVYFIRRDFNRNANGKISQKITIGCEGKIIDVDQFEKMIGKIKDFLFISFFDSFSIEKWLNTKPTERYRMFLNYFGLGNIEEKSKICKKEYDDFLKASTYKKYYHLNIGDEIKILQDKIEDYAVQISSHNNQLKIIKDDVVNLQTELQRLQNQFKGVPDSLLNETEESLIEKIKINEKNIKEKNEEIENIQKLITFVSESKEELSANLLVLQDEICKVAPNSSLISELETLNYLYNNFILDSTFAQQKEEINKKIENLRTDFVNTKSTISNKEDTLNNTPNTQICPNCKVETDNSDKKNNLKSELNDLNLKLGIITQEGTALKEQLKQLDFQIKDQEIKYKKDIKDKISSKNLEIEQDKKHKIDQIREKIAATQSKLLQYSENESKLLKIEKLKEQISYEQKIKDQNEDKLKVISNYSKDLNFNSDLKKELDSKKILLNDKINEENILLIEIKFNEKQIQECENQIQVYEQVAVKITEELKTDTLYKIYLDIHSKGGLAMKILQNLANDINADLSTMLSEEDFTPSIKIEDDAIEFYFYRDNEQFNMNEGSGYEKTILLLSLHYLLLSKMTIPVSNIFILDEVFVGVAKPFLHRTYNVVESMLNMFETILLITHVQDISEWCTDSIKITKNNNISKILQ